MKIALGSDHRGHDSIRALSEHLRERGHDPVVLGPCTGEPCDYPDAAWPVARAVGDGEAAIGILVCGSGVGMSMAANKVTGVRAALACDEQAAEMSRRHNHANVLCLAGDRHDADRICAIADVFIATGFDGGRHERRVEKIATMERGEHPASARRDAAQAKG